MLEPYDCPHDFLKMEDVAREYVEKEKTKPGEITGIRIGYDNLDEFTGGLQPGELTVVSGYPHMGKSFFLINVALNVAIKQKIPVAYFSLGEKRWILVERILSSLGKFSSHRLRTGFMREEGNSKLFSAQKKLEDAPLYINDLSGLTVPEMKRDLDRLATGSIHVDDNLPGRPGVKVGLVIVDHLQLIQSWSEEGSRKNEVRVILDELKSAARDMEVPFIMKSRLYPPDDEAATHLAERRTPVLEDLMRTPETAWIYKYADTVMFCHREVGSAYSGGPKPDSSGFEVRIEKCWNGLVGSRYLSFDHETGRISEL